MEQTLFPSPGTAPRGTTIRELPPGEQPEGRLRLQGAEQLSNAELVTILVQRGPQGTCPMAMATTMMATFDGLHGLAAASFRELVSMPGMGPVKACQLRAAFELGRRSVAPEARERVAVRQTEDTYHFLKGVLAVLDHEELHVLCLNTKHEIFEHHALYRGTVNAASVRVAEVVRPAIRGNHPNIILAHNHPSGDCTPSPQDKLVTRNVRQACELHDIELLDHVVMSRRGFVSMKQQGLGFHP